jgi:hypothetical protein
MLSADTEFLEHGLVTIRVRVPQVRQQTAAAGHHLQKTPPRRMVLLMRLEVIVQLGEPLAQQRNLNFRGAGVGLPPLIACNNLLLYVGSQRHLTATTPLSSLYLV